MDQLRFYNRRINSSEIRTLFNERLIITATNEIQTKNFNVYPNPTSDILTLNSSTAIKQFEIYSLVGQRVLQGQYQTQIDVSELQSGQYLITVLDSQGNYSTKSFVKK